MHKTKLANDLEEALKRIQENVTDQTNSQDQITDKQNDEDISKVCFILRYVYDGLEYLKVNYKIMLYLTRNK